MKLKRPVLNASAFKILRRFKMTAIKKELKVSEEVLKVESELMFSMGKFLRREGFLEILPVIISPITDPLDHSVMDAKIKYYDGYYSLTKSMIFHKQLALRVTPKIFVFSPNIRLETKDKDSTGRHLIEFIQLDLESKDASRDDILDLIERMLVFSLSHIQAVYGTTIKKLNPKFKVPKIPFERVKYLDSLERYGTDFEKILSDKASNPLWLIDVPILEREFYDRLSNDRKTLVDMDLIYPYGFGEGLSGGEREFEYERIVSRMEIKGNNLGEFKWYLDEVRKGLPRSAGCGIGIERLTRFICGLDSVEKARLFAKMPGKISL
jgi:asparaginyl-tRNA synthetase